MVDKRFRVLRIIGTLYKILAWVILVIGTLSSVGVFIGALVGGASMSQLMPRDSQVGGLLGGVVGGLITAIISLVLTLLYFVFVYGVGELIYLFLAIEENTRATSAWLARWMQPQAAPMPPQPY